MAGLPLPLPPDRLPIALNLSTRGYVLCMWDSSVGTKKSLHVLFAYRCWESYLKMEPITSHQT